jgi:membrane protein implicated in regulation of membrane protease activity
MSGGKSSCTAGLHLSRSALRKPKNLSELGRDARRPALHYHRLVPAWLAWAVVAVLLAIGEVLTPGLFFLGPLALAAVAAAAASALGGGWVAEIVVFVAGSAAALGVLRPIARRHLHVPPAIRTGTAALVGARAVVVERVDAHGGQVKIGGEVWSARALDESAVLEPGAEVEVAEIQGATALVYR